MSMQNWRLINSGFQAGAMNMALDEALLHSVANGDSLPVLRFYRWQPATVTLGYAQSIITDLDQDVCRQAGLDVVRRSTGGRAVLHDQEVTYSVIAPLNTRLFGNSVLDCYRVISEILQKTLVGLGLPAELVPGKPRGGHLNAMKAVCFSAPSQYELVINGCKVAGSAQKRFGQTFLQHGSIPIEMDLELLGKALKVDVGDAAAASLNTVGWLNQWSAKPLVISEVEKSLAEVFAKHLQIEWVHSEPTSAERQRARQMNDEKFGHPGWNLKR
ncbi:MAG: lipoate--protein ligase family protein [Desulfuromonadales bacterium]|nr:lipoate--protein ligase family protein [Desulfuromonadales bacterium]